MKTRVRLLAWAALLGAALSGPVYAGMGAAMGIMMGMGVMAAGTGMPGRMGMMGGMGTADGTGMPGASTALGGEMKHGEMAEQGQPTRDNRAADRIETPPRETVGSDGQVGKVQEKKADHPTEW